MSKSNLDPNRYKLQQVSYEQIETPVLEQFMHESNIRKNMGNLRGR